MKNALKLVLSNLIFSLIYLAGHFIFSMIAHDTTLFDMIYLFMSVCYIVISFVMFILFGRLFKFENKNDYLKCYLTFCAVSIILWILLAIFDTNLFVIFNTAPLFFDFELLALFFPIIDELELSALFIMLIENAVKISALYLGSKVKPVATDQSVDQSRDGSLIDKESAGNNSPS